MHIQEVSALLEHLHTCFKVYKLAIMSLMRSTGCLCRSDEMHPIVVSKRTMRRVLRISVVRKM